MTLNNTASREEFQSSLEGRLIALSRAHDLLTQEGWRSADLKEILSRELAPYDAATGKRIGLDGPRLALPPRMALTLAMAFHELTTNAAKYGALSSSDGSVAVGWRLVQDDGVEISWTESGGPTVKEPTRKGFGTRLIQRSISRELSGEAVITYAPAGVQWEIRIPAWSNLQSDEPRH
jgi:two-component sensor histidine kinase